MALTLKTKPRKVRVHLDWYRGILPFFDLDTNTHTFTEKLFPYFYTVNVYPLKIIPRKIALKPWSDSISVGV